MLIEIDLFDKYIESVAEFSGKSRGFQKENRPSPLLVDLLSKERVGVHPRLTDIGGQNYAPGMVSEAHA